MSGALIPTPLQAFSSLSVDQRAESGASLSISLKFFVIDFWKDKTKGSCIPLWQKLQKRQSLCPTAYDQVIVSFSRAQVVNLLGRHRPSVKKEKRTRKHKHTQPQKLLKSPNNRDSDVDSSGTETLKASESQQLP